MSIKLSDPIYHDEDKALAYLEAIRWPNGPFCPYCTTTDRIKALGGKSMGPGWYHCGACRKKFTVRVGSIFERSHIPLTKWLMGFRLMASSKKGISAHQLHRLLDITYKSAWFMAHRIREAMSEGYVHSGGQMGGEGQTIEADEAYIGPSAAKDTRLQRLPKDLREKKMIVFTLVQRGGSVRSFKIKSASKNTLMGILQDQANERSRIMTDENPVYRHTVRSFKGGHGKINHSSNRYVRLGDVHTNTVENYFSILKRGITGTYQHVSERHLHRYLAEFDFRYSHRAGLEINDSMRADLAIRASEGKRLTYQQSGGTR
jgi:transposase-like protein